MQLHDERGDLSTASKCAIPTAKFSAMICPATVHACLELARQGKKKAVSALFHIGTTIPSDVQEKSQEKGVKPLKLINPAASRAFLNCSQANAAGVNAWCPKRSPTPSSNLEASRCLASASMSMLVGEGGIRAYLRSCCIGNVQSCWYVSFLIDEHLDESCANLRTESHDLSQGLSKLRPHATGC